jgi:hypothetical protein
MSGGVEVGGEKGSIVIDRSGWTFHPKEGEPVRHEGSNQQKPHTANFIACVQGKAKPAASIEEGHKSATLCHLANIVSDLKRSLRFDSATQRFPEDPKANKRLSRDYRDPWTLEI